MSERILIDKIITSRKLEADDPVVGTLIESMSQSGQRIPVLVIPAGNGFELVDGLRRMDALRAMGEEYVEADVVTELQPALRNLERAHLDPPDRIRRVWEVRQTLNPLVETYNLEVRTRRRPVDGNRVIVKVERLRDQFMRAFGGLRSFDKILSIYRGAERGNPESIKAVRRMEENGLRSPYAPGAWGARKERLAFNGPIKRPQAQLEFMEALMRSISNSVMAVRKLGPLKMSQDDLKRFRRDLASARFQITKIMRLLEEAANDKQG